MRLKLKLIKTYKFLFKIGDNEYYAKDVQTGSIRFARVDTSTQWRKCHTMTKHEYVEVTTKIINSFINK